MFTNPTKTPPPRYVRVEKGCRADKVVKGARYRIDRIEDFEHGARLEMTRISGPPSKATILTWVRYRKHFANNHFRTNRGNPLQTVRFFVTARKSG